jgi:multimeric flavodoxin WrbA
MQDVNVLVTFCSRMGATERIALAAAVGAVQARANIRLRWLREVADEREIERIPEWREHRERMSQEYIAPKEADAIWADALIIGIPARVHASSPEFKCFLDLLEALRSQGKLDGKVGTSLDGGALSGELVGLGLVVVPGPSVASAEASEAARLQGRRATEVARALKQAAR